MSRVIVGAEFARPTHDVSLSDGTVTIGLVTVNSAGEHNPLAFTRAAVPRTAMKTTSGDSSYSDFEPPWSPIAQADWSGGRGMEDFDKDVTRFFDSKRVNSGFGTIFLGPQENYTTGYRNQIFNLPGSISWVAMLPGTQKYLAIPFTANANFDARHIYLFVKRKGTPTQALTVELCGDGSGKPGGALQTVQITTGDIPPILSEFYRTTITAQSLTLGNVYWIKVYAGSGDSNNHWKVGVKNATGTTKESNDGTAWVSSNVDLYYRLTDTDSGEFSLFFQYKRMEYCLRSKAGSVKLYQNGDRGIADANTGQLSKLIDATKNWETDAWAGCIVVIVGGTGTTERQPWRTITANDATSLTVDRDWEITHDTTTDYVIIGANRWYEITGHGITQPIYSRDAVLVVNHIVYFCQGDGVNIRRMQWNSGTAVHDFADDGTNKAVFLTAVRGSSGLEIWRANNKDASSKISVSKATVQPWGSNLVFGTAVTFEDDRGNITGLEEYGDTSKQLYVFREGSLFTLSNNVPDEIPLREMRAMMESTNGIAHTVHNVYLYFNLGSGIERYYSRNLDDVGPNRDSGLPEERQGVVSYLQGYPGRYFAAVDAGASGYSSILMHNGSGWHEIYRAPVAGQRITAMDFQPIMGMDLDRLWIAVGDDLIWLGFPSGTVDPTHDANSRYTHEGHLVTGYMYAGLYDIYKLYNSLKLFTEHLENGVVIGADYQMDQDTEWHELEDEFNTSPIQEVKFLPGFGVTGKRMRIRLRLQTNDNTKTPLVKGMVTEAVSRVPVKFSYAFAFRAGDDDINLLGEPDLSAAEKMAILDQWAMNLTPLIMRCNHQQFDNKAVFIDPSSLNPIAETIESYMAKMTVIER